MKKFDHYQYITPPRAETKIMSSLLFVYEKKGWLAQVKKNGTNSVIFVPPKGSKPFAKTRHADDPDHKAWQFTPKSIAAFEEIQNDKWQVFNAELMHSKGHGHRDTNYVYDVLVYEGTYLLGSTVEQRQDILHRLFRTHILKGPRSHYVYNDNTWVVKNHTNDFRKLFDTCEAEDEGVVIKNPEGVLQIKDNASWAVKCRVPHKNYGF